MRIALIDGDILRYEVGAICEGDEGPMGWDYVADTLETKIAQICAASGATTRPFIFLTNGPTFRDRVAKKKPYKGNRKGEKPFHWKNIEVYLRNQYDVVEQPGLEADDMMALYQVQYLNPNVADETVICTRDKDLLQIPGWHYGWECGAQKERHLHWVDPEGFILMRDKGKVYGEGNALFYYQLLAGDPVDNIPGCPGIGPAKAYAHLQPLEVKEMFEKVREVYHDKGLTDEDILEQGQLLWMVREVREGLPALWHLPG